MTNNHRYLKKVASVEILSADPGPSLPPGCPLWGVRGVQLMKQDGRPCRLHT